MNRYKASMDKIVLSDEMKAKVMNAALSHKKNRKKIIYRRIRYGSLAACMLLFLCLAPVLKNVPFGGQSALPEEFVPTEPPAQQTPNAPPAERDETVTAEKPTPPASQEKPAIKTPAGKPEKPKTGNGQSDGPAQTARPDDSGNKLDTSQQSAPPADTEPGGDAPSGVLPPLESQLPSDGEPPEDTLPSVNGGNPMQGAEEFSELHALVGFDFFVPGYMPEGHQITNMSQLGKDFIQVDYESEDDRLTYRTGTGSGDISGDYNAYELTETEQFCENAVTVKSSEGLCKVAVWQNGPAVFSITSSHGILKEELKAIILNLVFIEE